MGARAFPAPKLPGAELEGPPDSAAARAVLTLSNDQAARYAQAYDSFMTATRPQRDSAALATDKMNERLATGDRAAAMFYADRLREFGDFLKSQQEKFEGQLHRFLSGDQIKAYRRWKDDQDRIYEEKNREEALRWQRPSMGERGGFGGGGGGGGGRMGEAPPDPRTVIPTVAGVAHADLGSQAVRVGRTLYITSQLALDSTGALIQGDLRAQAERAFANLTAVLRGAGAQPQDIVALTIYVVDYKPDQLPIVRSAGSSYFGTNPPAVTILGVEALAREGAVIAVGATAVTSGASWFSRMAGEGDR
jgi:enamine deaminase RidA (YjgF/YER057c/UK114 family)